MFITGGTFHQKVPKTDMNMFYFGPSFSILRVPGQLLFCTYSLKLRENRDPKRKGGQSQRATLCDDTPRLRREELHKVHFDKSTIVSVRIVKGACTSGAARDTPS